MGETNGVRERLLYYSFLPLVCNGADYVHNRSPRKQVPDNSKHKQKLTLTPHKAMGVKVFILP